VERLTISMVVQKNNFDEMREFVFLGKRFGADTAYFRRLADWGTFSPEELQNRSVHRADHPRPGDCSTCSRTAVSTMRSSVSAT